MNVGRTYHSTAILLKRGKPDLRILVVDKTDRFDWKVGESTVEVSAGSSRRRLFASARSNQPTRAGEVPPPPMKRWSCAPPA
jgi:hypothetical protein